MGRRRMTPLLLVAAAVVIGLPVVAALIGSLLPRDHVAQVTAELPAPPERVWALISDFAATASWRPEVEAVEMAPDGPGSVRFVEVSRQGKTPYEVVSQTPPSRQVVRVVDDGLPFGGTWTWELEPAGTATRLTITEAGFVRNPIFRLVGRFFFSPTHTMQRYLDALSTQLRDTEGRA